MSGVVERLLTVELKCSCCYTRQCTDNELAIYLQRSLNSHLACLQLVLKLLSSLPSITEIEKLTFQPRCTVAIFLLVSVGVIA